MKAFDASTTVGQLVAERPARARIFENLGIDYCCGGRKTIAEVCQHKGLDPASVVQVLQAAEAAGVDGDGQRDWLTAPLSELCDHIIQTHHEYLRGELPRLAQLVEKVASVHGDNHPELKEVRYTFSLLRAELSEHMMKEERILFPSIRSMEAGGSGDSPHCGTIDRPIAVMEDEHDRAGAALARMRQLTQDYRVPEGACGSYQVMLSSLAELEADMHQHVHKENNILFPRAMKLAGLEAAAR
jgi:regulator of cell morphogenesis and NO signaling